MNRKIWFLSIILFGSFLIVSSVGLGGQMRLDSQKLDVEQEKIVASADAWVFGGIQIPNSNVFGPIYSIQNSKIIGTEDGCAIVVWVQTNSLIISAQKINSSGHMQWENNVEVYTYSDVFNYCFSLEAPSICNDGVGGVIIAWVDIMGSEELIYTQRINSTGDIQWTTGGVLICNRIINTAPVDKLSTSICFDGSGGVIVAWEDLHDNPTGSNIYAQRVNMNGQPQWAANGSAICNAINDQSNLAMTGDGINGAIISWEDRRDNADDIYAQRVDLNGYPQWTSQGIEVCDIGGSVKEPEICGDTAGGAIVAWRDNRLGNKIYTQRIKSNGSLIWTTNGVPVCESVSCDHINHSIVSDNAGGCIIVWQENSGSSKDIYAQRIYNNGSVLWNIDGNVVCNASQDQINPQICKDNQNGIVVIWEDMRDGLNSNIYIQLIDHNGESKWENNGYGICVETGEQVNPLVANIGNGKIIAVWEDSRNDETGTYCNIYAQQREIPLPTTDEIPGFELFFLIVGLSAIIIISTQIIPRRKKL